MAARKLISLLLLAGGLAGMASVMVVAAATSGLNWYVIGFLPASPPPSASGYVFFWPGASEYNWQVWSVVAIAGALKLACYLLARRRQHRRGTGNPPPGPLAGFFPPVAASVFGALALAFLGLALGDVGGTAIALAACLALAVGYSFRTARAGRRSELIMTEAEDHLRETTAAGIAVGMTDREAQEAAISSFGPARAVIQAHQARVNRAALRSGETAPRSAPGRLRSRRAS